MAHTDRWTTEDVLAYYARLGLRSPSAGHPHPNPLPEGEGRSTHHNEAWLLEHVRALAKRYGYLFYHTFRSDRSTEGFPDVVLVGPTVIFAELKSSTGKLTEAQMLWIEMLRHTGAEVKIWRPADLPAIVARLAGQEVTTPSKTVRCWWCDSPVPPRPHNQRLGLCTIHAALGCLKLCAACQHSWPEHGPGGRGCLRFVEATEGRTCGSGGGGVTHCSRRGF